MSNNMIKEISRNGASGYPVLVILPILLSITGWFAYKAIMAQSILWLLVAIITFLAILVLGVAGFFMVHPNQARVLTLFGTYMGSARITGLRWANPFYAKLAVSLRVRNFDCDTLKVNDSSGNPIEIAAVVVWNGGFGRGRIRG